MEIILNKKPEFENDSYLFTIKDFFLSDEDMLEVLKENPYTEFKYNKFLQRDVSKNGFEQFLADRGSLRFFDQIDMLNGSIYTHSVTERNGCTYQQALQMVKDIFSKNKDSRRAVLRIANPIFEYRQAEFDGYDVSCLNLIHYLNGQANLVFRSSDIEYELFTDIITIYEFFLRPIYGLEPVDIQIYGSTGQKIEYLDQLFKKLIEV